MYVMVSSTGHGYSPFNVLIATAFIPLHQWIFFRTGTFLGTGTHTIGFYMPAELLVIHERERMKEGKKGRLAYGGCPVTFSCRVSHTFPSVLFHAVLSCLL